MLREHSPVATQKTFYREEIYNSERLWIFIWHVKESGLVVNHNYSKKACMHTSCALLVNYNSTIVRVSSKGGGA